MWHKNMPFELAKISTLSQLSARKYSLEDFYIGLPKCRLISIKRRILTMAKCKQLCILPLHVKNY